MLRARAPHRLGVRRAVPLLGALAVLAAIAVAVALRSGDDGGPPGRPPGLGDLWSGRATLVFDRKWTSAEWGQPGGGLYSGAHVEIVGDTWYLFNRQVMAEQCGNRGPKMGTQVRASTDAGRTWAPPSTILAPAAGTPWACAATDGEAVFDPDRDAWRYLFQCHDEDSAWSGCYVERPGHDPAGPFEPVGENPVIVPGSLWSRICDDPADVCRRAQGQKPILDEGTFGVFKGDGDGWLVGFHGTDGTRAYRGIARTDSFEAGDWDVNGDAGTPTDAVLSAADAAGWRESWLGDGPVGAGAASVVRQDGFYYQVAEFPDLSLGCTPGQTWDLGLFRARDLDQKPWEQYPRGNPVVYSSRAPGRDDGKAIECNVEYPSLFVDDNTGTTYLMYGRLSKDPGYDGIYVYRVEWNRNLLENGDLWRADAQRWRPLPGTSVRLEVPRAPDGSPDGTPYLAFNCGAATCDGVQSVYQDVPAGGRAGQRVAFGGTFRTESGTGSLDVKLFQLDAAGSVVGATNVHVAANETYQEVRGSAVVDRRARTLRFQLTPGTPGGLRADNLYVIPQQGCDTPRYPAC